MPLNKNSYELKAYELCQTAIEEAGYELLEVQYRKEQGELYLTFIIDKRGGIGIADCEAVNNIVDPLMDTANIISEAYNLEVSSAGIDRPLQTEADFKRYIDSEVEVSCYSKYLNCKRFIGYLLDYTAGTITIDLDLQAMQKNMDKKSFKEFAFNLQQLLKAENYSAQTSDKATYNTDDNVVSQATYQSKQTACAQIEQTRQAAWQKFKVQTMLELEEPLELSFAPEEWSLVKRYVDFA